LAFLAVNNSMSPRWILHADMDAFYASVEQRDHPELRGRPVIVGAGSPRGVVAAASYEARRFGVRSAMPGFRARQLCPEAVFVSSDMAHYAAISAEVQAIFERFTPLVEPLSLDEAFLDIGGSVHLFGGVEALAQALRRTVFEETELPISVGVAPVKLVAKIACNLAKPNGLKIVPAEQVRAVLDPLPVGDLWGVGPVLQRRLAALGIQTLAELARYDTRVLTSALGVRATELQLLARGEDPRPVIADREPKSYGEENTFEIDVSAERRIAEVIASHADAVMRRVRRDGYRGRTVTLKIKLGRSLPRAAGEEPHYPLLTRSKTLSVPTDDAEQMRRVALELWQAARVSEPIRLLGVSLSGLVREGSGAAGAEQLELFREGASRPPLGAALDAIVERFGEGSIRRAVDTPDKITHSRQLKRGVLRRPDPERDPRDESGEEDEWHQHPAEEAEPGVPE
jgi:DNA polymerase IV